MKSWAKIVIGMGAVIVAVVLISVIHHYQLRAEVNAYIAQLKAKGEPLDLAQVIPPPVPAEQNGVSLITNAFSRIVSDANYNYTNWIVYENPPYTMNRMIPRKEMNGWTEPVIHDPQGTWPPNQTNTWNELGAQLNEQKSELDDLRKLIEKPEVDFDYDYSNLFYIPSLGHHLEAVKLSVEWLAASEDYNLHQNKTDDACTDVRTMLALIKADTDERFEVSQLIRFSLVNFTIANATWDVLQTTNVSDWDLTQLQDDWQALDFVAPLKSAFLFERYSDLQLVNNLRHSPTNLDTQIDWTEYTVLQDTNFAGDDNFFRKFELKILTHWDKFRWRWYWSYTDEIRGLKMWQTVIDGTQIMETNASFQAVQTFLNTNFAQEGFESIKGNPFMIISQNTHNQINSIKKLAKAVTIRNMVITAIALKRYEIQQHHLPMSLDELTPHFLNSVPIDYMDGKPLRYRLNSDGTFLLYSVGENCKDDGGNSSYANGEMPWNNFWQNVDALDWVWPQAASPEEVQKYYANFGKQE